MMTFIAGILAQVNEADSPNEIFSDFLGQIPSTLVLMVCGASLLLFAAFAWFAYFKPLRRNLIKARQEAAIERPAMPDAVPQPTPAPTLTSTAMPNEDDEDLPDLDLLVDPKSMRKPLPEIDEPVLVSPSREAPPPARRGRSGADRLRLASGAVVNGEPVLSILRDKRDGRLVVELDQVAYRTLTDAPEARATFVKLMRELSQVVAEPDDNPPPLTEEADEPARPRSSAPPPPITPDGRMPGDLPSYSLDESVKPTRSGRYQPAPTPELNIAGAIEAYLQHKLKYTPEFSDRTLHILPAPGGGVRIQVDDVYFEAVDEVDDEHVREFLLETIAEWQARQ